MKKNTIINLTISGILLVVYVAFFLIDLFTTKQITLSSFILCVGALTAYSIFLSRMDKKYYLGILVFTFFAQFLGGMLHFYLLIPSYDIILHLASGALLVLLADYIFNLISSRYPDKSVPEAIRILFCFFAAVASAACWEIWEYSGDKLLKLNSQLGSLDDTMTDIIAGTIGAVIGVVVLKLLFIKFKKKATA